MRRRLAHAIEPQMAARRLGAAVRKILARLRPGEEASAKTAR